MLRIVPVDLAKAQAFVRDFHRHHKPPTRHKFSIGVAAGAKLVGVAIVGRPVARWNDVEYRLEVTRVCTDGHKNGCSILYAAAARAAKALGYLYIGTYIRADETGTSLRAAGWEALHSTDPKSWDAPSRPRHDQTELVARVYWQRRLY